MFLVSSNQRKLAEFERFGLNLELRPIADLPEVDGTPQEIALYKAKMAGLGAVVEDTVLFVDGYPWVDIKWSLDLLRDYAGHTATWQVSLAHNDGDVLRLYVGKVEGTLVCPEVLDENAFGFDPYFLPNGETRTLAELDNLGLKDSVSARRLAADALLADDPLVVLPMRELSEWIGDWQNSGKKISRPRADKKI